MNDYTELIAEAREVLAQWDRDRAWMPRSPLGMIERLADALESALSAHPAEETDSRAAAWQEGWERGFRDMQAAERDEDGYVVVKPTRNPYGPVPEGSETA